MRHFLSTPARTVPTLLLLIVLVATQVLLSPTASPAQPKEKQEKIYQTPNDLGDGAKAPAPVANSWLVGDLDSGELHVAHEIEKRHAPASTIKLLTALALVEVLDDPEQKVEAEYEDMEIDGTKVGIMQKNSYTVDQLFHALLMSSANDAANALGRAAGGQDKAVELMNAKAAELGMTNTLATDTSGLDDTNQYTTVGDLTKLAWAVCENDYLMTIIGTETYKFPGGKNPETKEKFKGYQIQNHTRIVGEVEGGLGLKNGFTEKAEGSYVAVAERDGKRVVSAILGADNNSRQSAVDLLEWDFAQKSPASVESLPVGPAASPTPAADPSATAGPSAEAAQAADQDAAAAGTDDMNSDLGALLGGDRLLPLSMLAGGLVLLVLTVLIWTRTRKRTRTE